MGSCSTWPALSSLISEHVSFHCVILWFLVAPRGFWTEHRCPLRAVEQSLACEEKCTHESLTTGRVRETKQQPRNSVVWYGRCIKLFCSTAPYWGLEKADTLRLLWNTAPNNCSQTIPPRGARDSPTRILFCFLGQVQKIKFNPDNHSFRWERCRCWVAVSKQQRHSTAQLDYRHREDLGRGGVPCFFPEISLSRSYFVISTD